MRQNRLADVALVRSDADFVHFTELQHRLKLGIVDNKQATSDFTPKRLHIWRNIVLLALREDMQEHNPLPVTVRHEASEPAAPTPVLVEGGAA